MTGSRHVRTLPTAGCTASDQVDLPSIRIIEDRGVLAKPQRDSPANRVLCRRVPALGDTAVRPPLLLEVELDNDNPRRYNKLVEEGVCSQRFKTDVRDRELTGPSRTRQGKPHWSSEDQERRPCSTVRPERLARLRHAGVKARCAAVR